MTASLFGQNTAEIQSMRVNIVEMLRSSFLQEEMKKELMTILPYLPFERLQPIYEKLKEEHALHNTPHAAPTRKVREVKAVLAKIKREAWREAERENTPPSAELEQKFAAQLSRI